MRDRLTRILCLALTAASGLALVAPLLDSRRLIAGGDVTAFHLPLRTVFRRLALAGEPYWNPLVNGGQPILSNPNYAAFYPVTWALLPFEPATALHLLLLIHLAWAAIGAWRLATHLGCGASAAAVATLGFTCGPLLGLAATTTIVCSWSWFPWIVRWADTALERRVSGPGSRVSSDRATAELPRLGTQDPRPVGRQGAWMQPAMLAAGGLAMQLVAGDPTSVLLTGVAVAALALFRPPRGWARAAPRLAIIAALAAVLAAVQLLPTLTRVGESARAGASAGGVDAVWSLPPARFVEWLQPHAFGTAGYQPGYLFARGIHDRGTAYVPRLSIGLLPFILGLAAALRWRVPRRGAWIACAAGGLFLALGRHNPLAAFLHAHVPPFQLVRYPEKYVLLTAAAVAFLGALGWQHLLDRRRLGRRGDADFPAVLSLLVAGLLGAGLVALVAAPESLAWLVKPLPDLEVPADYVGERLAFLRRETGVAIAVALGLATLLFSLRRLPLRAAAVAAVTLLALDLVWFGRTAMTTEPRAELLAPPPVLDALPPQTDRVYAAIADLDGLPVLPGRRGDYLSLARWRIHHLAPYSGNLFGMGYIASVDYDALATRWARWQTTLMDRLLVTGDTDRAYRFLGSWNVPAVVLPRTPRQLLRALAGSGDLRYADAMPNRYLLPRYRPLSRVSFHATPEEALEATLGSTAAFREHGHWIGSLPPGWPRRLAEARDFELLSRDEHASRIELRYRTPDPTAFVAAMTFHPGWTARVDGERLPTHPTEAGQIGLLLPAGRHTLTLRFFEQPVAWGGAVTLAALLLCGVLWKRSRGVGHGGPTLPLR